MKQTNLIAALTVLAMTAHAGSPDGKYKLEVGGNITVVDSAGTEVLLLAAGTGNEKMSTSWNPDSTCVVVAENLGRSSDVIAAYLKDGIWHKAAEDGEAETRLIRLAEVRFKSRVISEIRRIVGWSSTDSVKIQGVVRLANGSSHHYGYSDKFEKSPTHRSPAGYEIGGIKASDYWMD